MGRARRGPAGNVLLVVRPPERRDHAERTRSPASRRTSPVLTWEHRLLTNERRRPAGSSGACARCSTTSGASWSTTRRSDATSPSASAPRRSTRCSNRSGRTRRRCERPIAARTNSWPCWPTSCEIRWRPIAMAVEILRHGARRGRADRLGARDHRPSDRPARAPGRRSARRRAHHQRDSIQLRTETVDLARIIASTLEISRPLIVARQLELDTDLPPGPLLVKGDPSDWRSCSPISSTTPPSTPRSVAASG